MKNCVIVGLIVFGAGIVFLRNDGGTGRSSSKKSQLTVSVATVEKGGKEITLQAIGTATSNESVDIMSSVAQKVVSVHFSDCEAVKRGQLLVQLNIDKKMAEKKQAEINLLEQQREFNRLEMLKTKKVIPEKDYDVQKSKLQNAQAKLDEISAEIRESSIVAPFDGILGMRNVSVGAFLNSGNIITTIDDIDKLKVDFVVPEKYSLILKPNAEIVAESVAIKNKKFYGSVLAIVPRVSPTSRSISVRGLINNEDHLLKPGMMLSISIKLGKREIISVPEKALSSIGEKHYLFVLNGENKVKSREVVVGDRADGSIEIQEGIDAGDKIVIDGLNKLSDGDTVTVANSEGQK